MNYLNNQRLYLLVVVGLLLLCECNAILFGSESLCTFGGPVDTVITCHVEIEVNHAGVVDSVNSLSFLMSKTRWLGNFGFSLTSPEGTTVVLTDETDCVDASEFTLGGIVVFTENAVVPFSDACNAHPHNGVYAIPKNSFSAFMGETAAGKWTVTLSDKYGGDDEITSFPEGTGLDISFAY